MRRYDTIKLISINEAAAQGVERLRKLQWRSPLDHLKIDVVDGRPGPWTHLYSTSNKQINGRDPVDFLCIEMSYEHTGLGSL